MLARLLLALLAASLISGCDVDVTGESDAALMSDTATHATLDGSGLDGSGADGSPDGRGESDGSPQDLGNDGEAGVPACADVDCGPNASCLPEGVGYRCHCSSGYVDNGVGCVPEPRCGDGAVQSPETCDDGNNVDHDGCSTVCRLDSPGTPYWEFGGFIGRGSPSNYPHPLTGTMDCPTGFTKEQVLGTTADPANSIVGDWVLWVCVRPYAPANRYLDFGGMYGRFGANEWRNNPITGTNRCPANYAEQVPGV